MVEEAKTVRPWEETWRLDTTGWPARIDFDDEREGNSTEIWGSAERYPLIVAAPKLYRALYKAWACLQDLRALGQTDSAEELALDDAEAALREARGET
jgi:hypothetical protein